MESATDLAYPYVKIDDFRDQFKAYISKIPASELGPLIIMNPGEKWRIVILKRMLNEDYIIPDILQDKIEDLRETSLEIWYKENPAYNDKLYSQFKTFHCENWPEKYIPSIREFKNFYDNITQKEIKLKNMSQQDFELMKLSLI